MIGKDYAASQYSMRLKVALLHSVLPSVGSVMSAHLLLQSISVCILRIYQYCMLGQRNSQLNPNR